MIDPAEILISLYRDKDYSLIVPENFPKQLKAIQYLNDQTTEFLLYGGAAGGGKSWTGWTWLIFNCLAYPETYWFAGRNELQDIRIYGLQTFNEVCQKYQINKNRFRFNGQDNYIQFETGSRIDLLGLKYLPSDTDYQRLGSTLYTGGFLEEAGEIHFDAYDTLKSRIGRYNNDRYSLKAKIFITCNPVKNWLYREFYKPAKSNELPDNKKYIPALVSDNPMIQSNYITYLDSIETKAKKERLRFGNWEYEDDPASLINYDSIQAMFTNTFVKKYQGGRYISADIALHGSDLFCAGVWEGFTLIAFKVLEKAQANEVEKEIRNLAYQYDVPEFRIVYDGDGLGSYLGGYLFEAQSFINNSSPVKGSTEGDPWFSLKENYRNLKSQCYFRLAKMINKHKIFISCDLGKYKEMLIEELEQVKDKSHGTDMALEVVSKKEIKERLGRSPDLSDMLMMRMYFTLHPYLSDPRDIENFTNGNNNQIIAE